MLVSRYASLGFMLLNSIAIYATIIAEPLPPSRNHLLDRYGQMIRDLTQTSGRYIRKWLGIKPRDNPVYYGEYQSYGSVST